ncbi:GIY-YIG nuclease family protein [Dyella thiooxydans]|uniref:GIY-YIG nuclease family protein n=1 Tax=Dyella thiooxydans TaxID=445710 RepID=UPI0012FB403E|nr:GIY-YIG nuclease family protein [Dyella thiooxydans]
MLTFNQLLDSVGIPPKQTHMARHQSKRGPLGKSPADLWRAGDGSFERYQCIQSDPEFAVGHWLASFVPGPNGETLFVGLYRVLTMVMNKDPSMTCPIGGHSVLDHHFYTMERLDVLDAYVGRLVIEWGKAKIAWVQWAGRQPKAILEIRANVTEAPFPGHIHFISTIQALADVPATWKSNLTNSRGVYLLVSKKTGQQYVGSATGSEGFWGRWQAYVRDGHGGNELMKDTADEDYQVSILEVASSSASEPEILRLEALWMKKLTTTINGLNSRPGKRQTKA